MDTHSSNGSTSSRTSSERALLLSTDDSVSAPTTIDVDKCLVGLSNECPTAELPSENCLSSVLPDKYNALLWAQQLSTIYSPKFLAYLTLQYFFVKGVVGNALLTVQLPYFQRSLGVSGAAYQRYYSVSQMAWSIKPLLGVVSDWLPLFGYHKRSYIAIFSLVSAACIAGATFLKDAPSSGQAAAGLFFLANMGMAGMDLFSEAKYSELLIEKTKEFSSAANSIVSWVWYLCMLGALVAASFEGPLADLGDVRSILWIFVPLLFLPFLPTVCGWLPEERISKSFKCIPTITTDGSSLEVITEPLAEQDPFPAASTSNRTYKLISAVGLATGLSALGMAMVQLFADELAQIIFLGIVVVFLCGFSFAALPKIAAAANVFMFLKEAVYFRIPGALQYWYTADDQCVPGGPNFDFTYYQMLGNVVGSVGGLLGVFLFEKYLQKGHYRHVFWLTTGIKCVASFFDVIMVRRWNLAMHIPDKAMYIFGDAMVDQMAISLDFMPTIILNSKICPKGMESTMYALVAGFANFGQSVSMILGNMLAQRMGIRTTAPCNWENMDMLIVICHMLLPLLVIPMTFMFLPNKKLTDELLDDEPTKNVKVDDDCSSTSSD